MDKEKILDLAREQNVQFINLQFVDILGVPKGVTIPVGKLEDAIDNHVWFDGSSIEGFVRISESDMYLKLDLDTYSLIPWESEGGYGVARIICDVYTPNGEPFSGDPRYILKRMIQKAKDLGFIYYTGPELEFFLFEAPAEGQELGSFLHDRAGYFDLTLDKAQRVRKEITFALQKMGIEVESLHHEVAAGQHEIDFKYDHALYTADKATTLRYVVSEISKKNGLIATFMPKPLEGINGSGMHVHQSLFSGEMNAFFSVDDDLRLSDTAKFFIKGQLTHIDEICAVTNPTINSYKRLVPGYEAPVYKCWGVKNRSALIRIPSYTKGKEKSVRCELRSPDPSANVYLAFALMLGAGLRGIEERSVLEAPVEEDLYRLSTEQLKAKRIGILPKSLKEALDLFKKSSFARDILGETIFESYVRAKEQECENYALHVSPWEREHYLVL